MDYKQLDKEYIASTYKRADVLFVKGKGATLFDDNGKSYIDFGSGIAVNGLGFKHKKWTKAVTKQIKNLQHTSNLYYTMPQTILAERLCKRTGLKKVFFSNSGAEANEGAIKCARKYSFDKYGKERNEIITLKNSFHGRTMATVSATGQDVFHDFFFPFLDGFKYVEANNFEELSKAVDYKTCAIMLELIQGESGVMPLDIKFVQSIKKLCDSKDILLIIDEVQTGNGRTGSLYAFQEYGVMPDIMTTAKGLGNGLPLGAVLFGEKTKDVLVAGTHGSTFGGNPVACAGAVVVLDEMDDEFLKGVKVKSERLISALNSFSKVKAVTGKGFMLGVGCDDALKVREECLKRGLVVLTAKTKLRLLPPLNISDKELEKGIEILREILG